MQVDNECRTIKGYPNHVIFPDGTIIMLEKKDLAGKTRKQKTVKKYLCNRGYYKVALCKDGGNKSFLLHRLLAMSFIPNPKNLPVINHIDGNKINNALGNLEWCTQLHNVGHAVKMGLLRPSKGEKNGNSKLKAKDILSIRRRLQAGETQKSIADRYGVNRTAIQKIKSGEKWAHV